MQTTWEIIEGDCRASLAALPAGSVQTCVTSPPYFGLRDYGHDGQIGLEPTPDEFVAALVGVFREVRRVLRDDGTVWLNLGDSYNADGRKGRAHMGEGKNSGYSAWVNKTMEGTKVKDLLGVPWMVAFALRADGWYLRSDIIWSKPNPMPESVTDRPTKAHEYLFLLSKQPRYFYDADAIREQAQDWSRGGPGPGIQTTEHYGAGNGGNDGLGRLADRYRTRGTQGASAARGVHGQPDRDNPGGGVGQAIEKRNKRSVWTVATQPFSGFDHRVRVERDAVGDDIQRTTSPSCPVHGGQTVPAPTARRGGRAGSPSRRSPDTYAGPDQGLLLDCAPTAPHPAPDSPAGSSDSLRHESPETETGRSSQSRRTDLAPVTTQPCTPSAGSALRTPGTSDQSASSAPDLGTLDRSSGEGDSGDPLASGTTDRTARRPLSSVDSACTCEFYRVERMDHFATFPPKLIEPCILAGCPEGGTVLDPFAGAGTTGMVALRHGRSFIGLELNPEYVRLARDRIISDSPLLNTHAERAA